ncbi:MAG: hypothetical protein K2K96_02295 [Lachnospiraceae bacterium]|nr:hypothetical protein [Lachnospiraceae bacterium]
MGKDETEKKYRAVNFDLSIDKLKEHYSETNPKGAYRDIRRFLEKNGFEHRQGSGYRSTSDMTDADALDVMRAMYKSMPWIDECSKKIDLTNIESLYDIKKLHKMHVFDDVSVELDNLSFNKVDKNAFVPKDIYDDFNIQTDNYIKVRAVNFDLSIEKLKEHYSETNPRGAYQDIRRFFENNGFERRQGSGYRSTSDMTDAEVVNVMRAMYKSMPWIDECSKKIDLTNISKIYDIKELLGRQSFEDYSVGIVNEKNIGHGDRDESDLPDSSMPSAQFNQPISFKKDRTPSKGNKCSQSPKRLVSLTDMIAQKKALISQGESKIQSHEKHKSSEIDLS